MKTINVKVMQYMITVYNFVFCQFENIESKEDKGCKNNNIIIVPEILEIPRISRAVPLSGTRMSSEGSGICVTLPGPVDEHRHQHPAGRCWQHC